MNSQVQQPGIRMKAPSRFMIWIALAIATPFAKADLAADFGSITSTSAGLTVSGWGSPGSIARHGTASFPVLMDANGVAMMAAGRYNDSYASTAACAVAFSHNGPLNGGANSMPALLEASVKWASRKTTPSTITVGCGAGINTSFWTSRGYLVKSVTTTMSSSTNDLSGVDVFVFDWHSGYSASAVTKIQTFTAAGGGIVCGATPWALGATPSADAYAVMGAFGLTYSGSGWDGASPATVPSAAPSPYYSALNGSDDLIDDKEGLITMSLANKVIAAASIDQVLAVRTNVAALNADMETLGDSSHYGVIAPTAAAPIAKASKPVEASLARYQSNKYDAMTPAQLFAHPSASDFPGAPLAGSTVSRTVSVNGNTAADFYMNQGSKPVRIETGVYAAPGATITITIPSDKTGAGLQAHISPNGSEDQIWNQSNWTFFPKLWRRVSLTSATTQTGYVMGGLVTILVPAGSSLGTFDVTVSGALPAPAFTLGVNTDAEWNSTLKNNPAPYGFIKTDKLVMYVERPQLAALTNPTQIANHWKAVMDTADEYYGYSAWRKRGEAMASARYVAYGAAYAGYPTENGWGVGEDVFLNAALTNSWGNYHELGHGFQDNFDGAFVIATHAEVDVNLLPGMVTTMIHKRTAWDNASHSTFDSSTRISSRASFGALPAAQQTWAEACGNTVGYDFYFNIADSFGWVAYKTALTRLMNYLQNPTGSTDNDIKNLNTSDPNFKRNRFYILFCDATGRNLDSYFQRYGLGVTGRGYEITQSVKDLVAAKGYPVWTDNTAPSAISNPGTLTLAEDTMQGTLIHDFSVTDVDPGETHTYAITAGDSNGDFSIDPLTGELRVFSLDYERATSYSLTITASGNAVPFSGTRHTITRSFTVNVTNTPDAPVVDGELFTASSAMSAGTVLGTASVTIDPTRTVSSWTITAGNGSGIFAINASGQVTLQTPGSLGSPAAYQLTVRATDSAGQSGYGQVIVYANASLGLSEERWTGQVISGSPGYTGHLTSFTSAQNVAENYTRRLTGWLFPPSSGLYTFWIASDDGSTLSLSTNSSSANKAAIGAVSGYTGFQSWDQQGSQKSKTVFLKGGQPYYIEAIQNEGGGGDHVAVAWQGPGITRAVIPGSALIPAAPGVALNDYAPAAPTITLTSPTNGASYGSPASIAMAATVNDNGNNITKVQFLDGATLVSEDYAPPYTATLNTSAAGSHPLKAKLVYGTSTLDSGTATVTVTSSPTDTDGDGYPDTLETALGTNPNSSSSQPSSLYSGLKSWWRLNESSGTSAADSSGYQRTGTVSGGTWTTGKDANGLLLDGTDDTVLVGNSAALTGTTDFTLGAWVKVNSGSPLGTVIQQREPGGSGYIGEYMLNVNANGTVNFFVYGSGGYQFDLTSTTAVNDGQWHYLSGVRSGTTGYLYIDGVQAATATGTVQSLNALAVSIGYDYRDTNKHFTGTIDDVRIYSRALSGTEVMSIANPYLLPSPWTAQDIGSTGVAGTSTHSAGTYTLNGSGADIWGTADAFHYVWQPLSGDGQIIARVASVENTDGWAKAGVMIRESLTTGSKHAMIVISPSNGVSFQRRTATGGSSTSTTTAGITAPRWVRITRTNNTLATSYSSNGTTWTTLGSATISMAANIQIGLAVSSHNNTTDCTAVFDSVTVTP
ncbi:M60 family metallopeptidase [Luteolibacter sp. GHJ8]|uniref:M60 family metallopeptidase n=2 Tax=Luteolibacter rhizosphaerae TaxID=2989719 RepID=A0ABT3G012_9BACT|nr:M60 family metallopeptidase [Luteolibacter rhizosphaerae]